MPDPAHRSADLAGYEPQDNGAELNVVADALIAVAGDAVLLAEDLKTTQTTDRDRAAAMCDRLAYELSGCARQLRDPP
jgi:hypothetical protein